MCGQFFVCIVYHIVHCKCDVLCCTKQLSFRDKYDTHLNNSISYYNNLL